MHAAHMRTKPLRNSGPRPRQKIAESTIDVRTCENYALGISGIRHWHVQVLNSTAEWCNYTFIVTRRSTVTRYGYVLHNIISTVQIFSFLHFGHEKQYCLSESFGASASAPAHAHIVEKGVFVYGLP